MARRDETSSIAVYPTDKPKFRKLCAEIGIIEAGDADADLFRKLLKKTRASLESKVQRSIKGRDE